MVADSLSISPITVSGLARVSSLAFPLVATGSVASNSASSTNASSIVTLSNDGQLLSAVSSLQRQLRDALQSSTVSTPPASINVLAQSVVSTFNNLQGNADARNAVVVNNTSTQLSSAVPLDASQLASLSRIGIELQPASATLSFNAGLVDAALANDPGATRAVLASTAQSLLDTTSGVELQLAGRSLKPDNSAQVGNVAAAPSASPDVPLATFAATGTGTVSAGSAVVTGAAQTNGDVEAADLRAATARTALQNMLSDPALQVLRNILDPFFPALVAATRISEMSAVIPIIDPNAFAPDLPVQVSAVPPSRAIGYYKDASVGS